MKKILVFLIIIISILIMGYFKFFFKPFNENTFWNELGINRQILSDEQIGEVYKNAVIDGDGVCYYGDGYNIFCADYGWNYIEILSNSYRFGSEINYINVGMDKQTIWNKFRYYKKIKDLPQNRFGYIINEMFWIEFVCDGESISQIILRNGL